MVVVLVVEVVLLGLRGEQQDGRLGLPGDIFFVAVLAWKEWLPLGFFEVMG